MIIYKKTWIKSLVKSSFKNDLVGGMVYAHVEILVVQILELRNLIFHGKRKHIDIKFHYICD